MNERERVLQELHNDLCGDLDRIKRRFKGSPKVSLIVRFEDPEKGLWLTNDTADDAIAYVRYMEEKAAFDQGERPRDAGGKD
jgi:hypothetical protein